MKKHIIKYLLVLLIPMVGLTGCDDFLDINKDPDRSTTVTPDQILPVITFYAAQSNYDHAEYGVYLSQALTTGGKSQQGSLAYKSGWEFLTMNRHPQWRRHFYDLGANLEEMFKVAEAENSHNFVLIGRTIRLMSTLFTTDAFGDMPLTHAYTSIAPLYDSQESIYELMLKEADDLLAMYDDPAYSEASSNKKITKAMDRIYGGDLSKWKLFTQGLKARILLRKLPNWDNTPNSCQMIIDAVDAALSSEWIEPIYHYDGGSGVKNCPWGPSKPIINSWESRGNDLDKSIPSKFFVVDMLGLYSSPPSAKEGDAEDPRLERYMTKRDGPASGTDTGKKYRYLENNIGMGVSYKETNYPDLYATKTVENKPVQTNVFTKNNGYISLMLTEELLFIKSEALYWKGDKQAAMNVMREAVDMNLERHNANKTLIQIYKGEYKAINPSPTEQNIQQRSIALGAKYFPTIDKFNIGHILRQKYVAMYLQPEQWNDMRRYNYSSEENNIQYDGAFVYPTLRRPYNLYEPYWFTEQAIAEHQWIQRLNYDPETEEKYNKKELERLGAYRNPEWLKKPMIWAVRK